MSGRLVENERYGPESCFEDLGQEFRGNEERPSEVISLPLERISYGLFKTADWKISVENEFVLVENNMPDLVGRRERRDLTAVALGDGDFSFTAVHQPCRLDVLLRHADRQFI